MLPARCARPPCTNIDVNTLTSEKYAGTRPNAMMNASSAALGQHQLEQVDEDVQRRSGVIVTPGVVREGMTSRRGIMSSASATAISSRSE